HPWEEMLLVNEYFVTGFDSSTAGVNTVTFHYNGLQQNVDLAIIPLTVTSFDIEYYPVRTEYYVGDTFDPLGLSIIAGYNTGVTETITPDKYRIVIPDAAEHEGVFTFDTAGDITVEVHSIETPSMSASFVVNVDDAVVDGLEIRQNPLKMQYFIGDELDLSGIVVFAQYSDDTEVRLLRDDFIAAGFDSGTTGDKEVTLSYKG